MLWSVLSTLTEKTVFDASHVSICKEWVGREMHGGGNENNFCRMKESDCKQDQLYRFTLQNISIDKLKQVY